VVGLRDVVNDGCGGVGDCGDDGGRSGAGGVAIVDGRGADDDD